MTYSNSFHTPSHTAFWAISEIAHLPNASQLTRKQSPSHSLSQCEVLCTFKQRHTHPKFDRDDCDSESRSPMRRTAYVHKNFDLVSGVTLSAGNTLVMFCRVPVVSRRSIPMAMKMMFLLAMRKCWYQIWVRLASMFIHSVVIQNVIDSNP